MSAGLYDVVNAVSAVFPFKPALQALDARSMADPGLAGPLVHLAILSVAFTGLARIALRRFG